MSMFSFRNGESKEEFKFPESPPLLNRDFERFVKDHLKTILTNQGTHEDQLLNYKLAELDDAKAEIKDLKKELRAKNLFVEQLLAHMLEHAHVSPQAKEPEEDKEPTEEEIKQARLKRRLKQRAALRAASASD